MDRRIASASISVGDGLSAVKLQLSPLGESDLILNNFLLFLCCNLSDDRPLFLFNFLERLDESIDLSPIFRALAATGRQVFIAVPRSYTINTLEERPYDATIHTL